MSTEHNQTSHHSPENAGAGISTLQPPMAPTQLHVATPFSNTLSQPFSLKLDRNNFPLWKTMVFTIIRGHRLEGYLNGQRSCPSEMVSISRVDGNGAAVTEIQRNPEYESWIVHDQLLMGWLYGSMTEAIASEVMGCGSAHALWSALEKLHGAHSKANMDNLHTKLQTTRKGAQPMTEYLKMKRM